MPHPVGSLAVCGIEGDVLGAANANLNLQRSLNCTVEPQVSLLKALTQLGGKLSVAYTQELIDGLLNKMRHTSNTRLVPPQNVANLVCRCLLGSL